MAPTVWLDPQPRVRGLEMSPRLDRLSLRFAMYAGRERCRALDVGCGTGVATLAALIRGAHVVAVDPVKAALEKLLAGVPACHYADLSVRVGAMPGVQFTDGSLGAIHASRVFHLLSPAALRTSLLHFRRWLQPGGRLYISAESPESACWEGLRAEYRRRFTDGQTWPGYFGAQRHMRGTAAGSAPATLHLLDENILRRELTAAGFEVDETFCYELSWAPDQFCCAVVGRVPVTRHS
jgi:SAM-dependent methyltransferase